MNEAGLTETLEAHAERVTVGPAPLQAIHDAARAHRRRRRVAVVAATVALVVPATFLAASLNDQSTETLGTAEDVQRALADYDASQMPHLLLSRSREAFTPAYPDLPEGIFGAEDGLNYVLPPEHYDKASWLSVDYRPSPVQALTVWIGHQVDPSDATLREQCANEVEAGIVESCGVVTARGEYGLESVSVVTWRGDGPGLLYGNRPNIRATPMHLLPEQLASTDPDTLWFEHQVEFTHTGGHKTVVTESVKATNIDDAQALFRVDVDDLASLASDPDFAIPRPPLNDDGCGTWSLKDTGQVCDPE